MSRKNRNTRLSPERYCMTMIREFVKRLKIEFSNKKEFGYLVEYCKYHKIELPPITLTKREVRAYATKIYRQANNTDLMPIPNTKSNRYKKQVNELKKEAVKRTKKPVFGDFYDSEEWLLMRHKIFRFYGRKCMKCNVKTGTIHVDHIKPRSKFKELELEPSNLQVLCKICNEKKSNLHCTDYRPEWAKTYDFTKI
jgi:5-methylcytosine-specific restriction endonuclease McrA